MSDIKDLYDIREYISSDKPFIMATFLRGLYYGETWFSQIPKDVFMDNYKRVAEALLDRPNVTIRIACLKEDPDVILGYSISKGTVLDWTYVKKAWRGAGVGRSLLPAQVTAVTHLSENGKDLMKKIPNCIFNPFLI